MEKNIINFAEKKRERGADYKIDQVEERRNL